jgi:molecular chaperone DnaK (HSP70)/HEAT repeat protein
MGLKLAIDFGTTNSVVARWGEESGAETIAIPGLSIDQGDRQFIVPSLLYVQDGRLPQVVVGQAVRDGGFDRQRDNRLFRSFKRGIAYRVSSAALADETRLIDGVPWTDHDAGQHFLHGLLDMLPYAADDLEQLVITAPVAAFEGYTTWLGEAMERFSTGSIHVVDESTAAALGYAVTKPSALVLVFDFGGGSLDLSLVQLPESRRVTGSLLGRLVGRSARRNAARVIAKAGVDLGGSDIDQWLLAEVLDRVGLSAGDLGGSYAALLTTCEQAKIALSIEEATVVRFQADDGQAHTVSVERAELEALMEGNGFYDALRQIVDRVMRAAQRQGIYEEDVDYVLLVGGTSLIPSVQQFLTDRFCDSALRVDKPFTAVAEGALQVAVGFGLDDYLAHGYGLRCLDPETGGHAYDEIIPMGTRYPTEKSVEVLLGAAHPDQEAIEFVVGQVDTDAISMVEVKYEDGQAVFVAQADRGAQRIVPLNPPDVEPVLAPLSPLGVPGQDRLQAEFTVDAQRQLRLTVVDLQSGEELIRDVVIVTLERSLTSQSRDDTLALLRESQEISRSISGRRDLFSEGAISELAESGRSEVPAGAVGQQITRHEPSLSSSGRSGRHRLSLRDFATKLNLLPPEAVSLDALREALHSDEFYVRYSAAEMLSRRGDRDARLIAQEVLDSAPAPVRASVAHHLYGFSWFAAEPLLLQALGDEDQRVRVSAVYGLCKLRSKDAYQLMLEVLPGADDSLLLAVAWGLSDCQDARAVPVLEIALQARDPAIREKALESLGETRAPEGIPAVRRAMGDPDLEVKYAATLSLVELAGKDCFVELAECIEHTCGLECHRIVRGFFHATNYTQIDVGQSQHAEAVIDALEVALLDDLPETRVVAAMCLAWMRHGRAADVLHGGYGQEGGAFAGCPHQ